ncbi:sodium ion-translocating decarboxylase subunit beta [Clostridium sp.]|uniref:sodium ion-translocating decarboxylase subunit beta n=1 Tax=Clostridium sp. TaxID=1506 RepID=UPI003D6D7741
MDILQVLKDLWLSSGFVKLDLQHIIMIGLSCVLMYFAIHKKYEPLLLLPIAFGMLLVNLPMTNIMGAPVGTEPGGLFYYLYKGVELDIYPPLIFLGVGAMTDFGPLLANPSSMLMGAGAQFGVFFAFMAAIVIGFTPQEAASIGIIGGADGPTAIFITSKLAKHLLGPIAVAAYSYMALVPLIQPPIMKLLTTKEERTIKMGQLRKVNQIEKIIFPIVVAIVVILMLPSVASLIGMLMLGNLFKESGVVGRLSDTAQNALINIITIFLGLTVGATANAEVFISWKTGGIVLIGMVAFCISTAAGVIIGKIMCKVTKGKINPLIGSAGVSAVPMAARVSQVVGQKYDSSNFLLMNAMGPNVAGVIGTAVAAGILLTIFGK